MAKKRVIAYYMHETEAAQASQMMPGAQMTESFAVGEIEESDIARMRNAGLIVQEEPVLPPEEEEAAPARPGTAARGFAPGAPTPADDVPALVDYYLVRLRGPLIEPWRQQLASLGVSLLENIPRRGYKARLRADQAPQLSALDFVESVRWITPAQSAPKMATRAAPGLPGQPPAAGLKMLTFDVRLHLAEDLNTVENWLRQRNIAISGASGRKIRFFVLENSQVLDELARLPEVDTVAEHVPPKLYNDAARRLLGIDAAGGNPGTVVSQDGTDQIVAVADTGIDDQHPDFQGRIVGKIARGRPNDASDPDGHGTHVAGSVLGDGSASGGKVRGTAPKAKLLFQSLLDTAGGLGGLPLNLNDLFDEAYQAGARIHNNSWGADTPSMYTFDSEEVDEFVRDHPDMLIVIAAGNAGTGANPRKAAAGFVDWLSIGSPASCKNALTVGASRSDRTDGALSQVTWGTGWPNDYPNPPIANELISGNPDCLAAFSSRGPCDDRRIKPDVVAPGTDIASTRSSLAPLGNFWGPYPAPATGQPPDPKYAFDGGTSMATPLVSGCAALVRQYYTKDRNWEPSAALLKATLINSTEWLPGADSIAPTVGVPNYHQGHGRVSMRNAIPNTAQPNLKLAFVDNWKDKPSHFTRTGERRRYQFNLPKNTPELRITMAYTDAPARALQNNLNLMVQHIDSGTKWMGNTALPDALTLPDPDNNVESVKIRNPAGGTYFIQVFVGNMLKPPQDFALVVSAVGGPEQLTVV